MNKSILTLAALALSACVTLISCDKNNDPAPDDEIAGANIDYNEANAKSWGNYMIQVGALLKQDAADLYDSWTVSYEGGAPFATQFKQHTGGDYTSALSCIEQIVDGCSDIANEVGTAKIGDPLNLYLDGKKQLALYAVESWYSWHSRDDYTNNIRSIRNAFNGSRDNTVNSASISSLLAEINPTLQNYLNEAIANAENAIQSIPQPFRNNINSAESRKAMEACADLEELLSINLKAELNKLNENDTRLQAIVDNYVDNVVLPTYLELKQRNEVLYQACLTFNSSSSDANFAAACNAWLEAREPWETSEAFLFGPVDALGLDPNMDSWPLDQESIINILNSGNFDIDWTDADSDDTIEAKQGVRGFHTLEFLLFKDGNPRKVK